MFKKMMFILMLFYFVLINFVFADNLIIPGKRIGNFVLCMSGKDLASKFGKPDEIICRGDFCEEWVYGQILLKLTHDKVIEINTASISFKTDKNIKIGNSFYDVRVAYGGDYKMLNLGELSNERRYLTIGTKKYEDDVWILYSKIGISFHFSDKEPNKGNVTVITIWQPKN